MPDDILPGGKVITPASSAPIAVDETRMTTALPSRSPRRSSRRAPHERRTDRQTRRMTPTHPSRQSRDRRHRGVSSAGGRPTWAEVAPQSIGSAARRIDSTDRRRVPRPAIPASSRSRARHPAARAGLARFLGGSQPPTDEAVQPAVCRFDPSKRKLVDFQLPDVDGKTVSLHDIDADVILLDFWGSWCAPCRTSIPHLTELQKSLGGETPASDRNRLRKRHDAPGPPASASKAMQELGINYPVLLSSKEGSCPLQQALQIQFYPTMILLDRDGKLLAREQGATEVTMSRMDRAIKRPCVTSADPARPTELPASITVS